MFLECIYQFKVGRTEEQVTGPLLIIGYSELFSIDSIIQRGGIILYVREDIVLNI